MRALLLLFLVGLVCGTLEVKRCTDEAEDKCSISEIRITPCPGKPPCKIKKGKDATMEFDFVPKFAATALKANVTYTGILWSDLEPDACKAFPCPVEAEKPRTYSQTFHIGRLFPKGTFEIKWKIYDVNEPTNQCCFNPTIKLV